MVDNSFKQEACQVYIEQRIEDELKKGISPGEIGKELTEEIEHIFKAKVKPATIKKRVQRTKSKIGTFVPTPASENVTPPIEEVTPVPPNEKRRRTFRLPPKLDKDIIEYKDKHNLKHADALVLLLQRGLDKVVVQADNTILNLTTIQIEKMEKILKQISPEELQDSVSKIAIISKDTGIGQSVKEVLDDITDYYLYQIKQARLSRIETEQKQ